MRHLRWAAVAGVAALCLAPLGVRAASKGAAGHDLSGAWQLDRAKSDSPTPPPGMGMGHGGGGGGGMHQGGGHHGGGGGMGGPPTAGMGGPPPGDTPEGGPPREHGEHGGGGQRGGGGDSGMRRPGLPSYMRITSSADEVAIADSSGATVQEITFKDNPDAPAVEKHAPRVPGEWKGDKLTVTRTNSRGTKVTETFALEDGGKTLVVETKMQPSDGGGFEFKRVYRKAGA